MSDVIPAPAALTEAIDAALAGARTRLEQLRALGPYFRPGIRVALSTHINADGDGCGSEVGLARALAAMGLRPVIVNPTPWPDGFRFLLDAAGAGPGDAAVEEASARGAGALRDVDLLVVLDIADVKRLGTLADAVRALRVPKLTIDHHLPSDEPPSTVVVSDVSASATGELIFDLLGALDRPLTPAIATALYVALLTDTGGFRFSNTSPRCHAVAAELLAAGVDPEAMYRRIYASVPVGKLYLLRDALDTLEVDAGHGLAWISIPAGAMDRYGVKSEDLDGIVEQPRSIAGTRLAMLFRDLGHGKVKVSFRSTGDVDVNALARPFGGGGHAKASGAMIAGTMDAVRAQVLAAARAHVSTTAGEETGSASLQP